MQTVQASCPTCGDVVLLPQAISVTENRGDPEQTTYTFRCPKCGEVITKRADFSVLGLFATLRGVKWNVVRPPAELSERRFDGPPLTEQDWTKLAVALAFTPDHLIIALAGGNK